MKIMLLFYSFTLMSVSSDNDNMARNRMIKPEFWEDSKLAKCSPFSRLFFIATWNFADDKGFIEYEPVWLKAKCLPYDDVNVEKLVEELLFVGVFEQKNSVLKIKNFLKHQRIDRPQKSNLKQKFNVSNSTNDPRILDEHSATKREDKEKLNRRQIEAKAFAEQSIEFSLALDLFQRIRTNQPTSMPRISTPAATGTHLQKWAAEFDKILRVDGRSPEDIRSVLEFSQTDNFWQANILSPSKLREKYDQLKAKMTSGRTLTGVFIS